MKPKTTNAEELPKVPLKEYYESLSKEEKYKFMQRIFKRLRVNHTTIYRWLNGKTKPPYLTATIVAEVANKPLIELFPHLDIE